MVLPRGRATIYLRELRGDMERTSTQLATICVRPLKFLLVAATSLAIASSTGLAQLRGKSGLPLPRFASLKADPVNLRTGPGREYPKAWVFRRVGLPVEIYQEHQNWRRVRDSEGATGWIIGGLLSGRRTALIAPWAIKQGKRGSLIDLKLSKSARSAPVARLEAGTLANVKTCDGSWCHVSVRGFEGYVTQSKLWGIYEGEIIR
ncbi:MAG: SH3 domain-containing protein [Hyphomicrobiaceae bacterium]